MDRMDRSGNTGSGANYQAPDPHPVRRKCTLAQCIIIYLAQSQEVVQERNKVDRALRQERDPFLQSFLGYLEKLNKSDFAHSTKETTEATTAFSSSPFEMNALIEEAYSNLPRVVMIGNESVEIEKGNKTFQPDAMILDDKSEARPILKDVNSACQIQSPTVLKCPIHEVTRVVRHLLPLKSLKKKRLSKWTASFF